MKVTISSNANPFLTGLVFGFDVGTGSIGYAVRQGRDFKDVGVLICDSEGSELEGRRNLRRQRRTIRSRKSRREWFAEELKKIGLLKQVPPPNDPITLRLRALNGDALKVPTKKKLEVLQQCRYARHSPPSPLPNARLFFPIRQKLPNPARHGIIGNIFYRV